MRFFYTLIVISCCVFHVNSQIQNEEDNELIEKMAIASIEEVQSYMRDVLTLEVPDNHLIDKKYLCFDSYIEASEALGKSYPNFYSRQGLQLIEAVQNHPVEYRRMIFDYKRIRLHYGEY